MSIVKALFPPVTWGDTAMVDARMRAVTGDDLRGCLDLLRTGDAAARNRVVQALEEVANQPSEAIGDHGSGRHEGHRVPVTGLVLAGGGGKGAYQVGCWRAMRELGVDISVIAGTSVGGLNAALIAQGDEQAAQQLWRSITPGQVFRWQRVTSPFALVLRLALGVLGPSQLSAGPRLLRADAARWIAVAVSFQTMFMLFGYFVIATDPAYRILGVGGAWRYALVPVVTVSAAAIFVTLALAPYFIWRFLDRINLFVLDNEPLKYTITKHLRVGKVSASNQLVLVTSASKIEFFDPDQPNYIKHYPSGKMERARYEAVFETCFIPHYAALNTKSDDELLRLLICTSSLPFGIFPRAARQHDAGWTAGALDGGIADNTPLLPMLRLGVDRVIIIHLNHSKGRRRRRVSLDAAEAKDALIVERLTRLAPQSEENFKSFKEANRKNWFSIWEWSRLQKPIDEQPAWAAPELVHIVPSKSLGGLLTGTLRFSGRKSARLIDLGYSDTMRAFSR
jgi:predicted acylesterase/phospholipase RssA